MVLDGPHAVEAHLLGEKGLFKTVPYDLLFSLPGRIGQLGFEDHGKLHGAQSSLPTAVVVALGLYSQFASFGGARCVWQHFDPITVRLSGRKSEEDGPCQACGSITWSFRSRGEPSPREFRDEVDAFFCGVLGWDALDTEVVGQSCHLLRPDDGQFILLAESGKPMSSPGYDHLGLLMDTREEVDAMLAECQRFAEKDDRLRIKEYEDLTGPTITVHTFYVKYLLPIWFDVQCMEWPTGKGPARRWQYA